MAVSDTGCSSGVGRVGDALRTTSKDVCSWTDGLSFKTVIGAHAIDFVGYSDSVGHGVTSPLKENL